MASHETGIYEIKNVVNGKRYVGSAVHFGYRWTKHRSELAKKTHHSRHLQRAWDRYGPSAFEFKKLILCGRENLVMYEQAAMDAFKPEYNVAKFAYSCLGVKRTPEAIAKGRVSRIASGGWSPSAETRGKISATLKGRPGRPQTEQAKAKLSAAKVGKRTPQLMQLAAAKVGIPRPAEVREKLSKAVAKFDDVAVRSIRLRCSSGELQKHVAKSLGVTQSSISELVRGVSYGWVK